MAYADGTAPIHTPAQGVDLVKRYLVSLEKTAPKVDTPEVEANRPQSPRPLWW